MLLQFRKLTRGFVASIILGLVGLAMVIFLVPNMNLDQLGGSAHIAEVAGHKISPLELSRELDARLRELRNEGVNVTQEEAIEAREHERLLQEIITRTAVYAYAEKIGISASHTQVADYIREIPAARNPVTGAFDETAYAQLLSQLRYTRPQFEQRIRNDINSQLVLSALLNGVRAPSSYGALLYTFQAETRVISIADAPASAVGAIAPPNEAQLQAFWEENQARLRVPEFRALTLVYARPQDFVARVSVPEERLREEFEARRASLTTPERRTYVRISAQTQAQANDAAARLISGQSPDAVASALGLQVTRGADQTRNEVPDGRIAEAVFSQARGAVRAVQGQLTPWAVVRVDAITPGVTPTFESQREEIRQLIANDEAGDLLNAAIGAFDEARAAGAAVSDAARQAGLTVVAIPAVDAQGRAPDGRPIEALADQEELLRMAFETPESEASDFIPVGDADVVVAVDRVTASTVRPLSEVRDLLSQLWVTRERARRMRELGAEVVQAVRDGQTFEAAARARRFTIRVNSQPINREAAEQVLGPNLQAQVFSSAENAVVTDTRPDGALVAVVQIERINRPDPAAAPQVVEAARAQIEQNITSSLAQAAQDEVLTRANARRNERLLERLYPRRNADDAESQ